MTQNPLHTPYRVIRRVAPPDVPVPGVLVAEGDVTSLLIDLDRLTAPMWAHTDREHVWAPTDIVRTETGQAALLPWCSQTLATLLAKRRAELLSGGECVTIAVSMLRGLRELGEDETLTGTWWLTEDGCPMFVFGPGGVINTVTHDSAAALVEACADTVVRKALLGALGVFRVPVALQEAAQLEEKLFAAAAPQPVRVTMLAPVPASDIFAIRGAVGDGTPQPPGITNLIRRAITTRLDAWRERLPTTAVRAKGSTVSGSTTHNGDAEHAHAGFQDVRTDHRDGGAHGSTASETGKGKKTRLTLVATAAGAVVITIGMLWPQPPPASTASEPTSTDAIIATDAAAPPGTAPLATPSALPATGAPTPPPTVESAPPSESDVPPADVTQAAAALQLRAAECIATADPCPAVATDEATVTAFAAVTGLALVEDYGGVAIFRGTDADGDKYVVFEKSDGLWRCREVNPAPAAPSG